MIWVDPAVIKHQLLTSVGARSYIKLRAPAPTLHPRYRIDHLKPIILSLNTMSEHTLSATHSPSQHLRQGGRRENDRIMPGFHPENHLQDNWARAAKLKQQYTPIPHFKR